MKPLTLWGHWGAPNPWKVRMVLDELEVPYTMHELELTDTKSEEHVKLNPNGRLPTLEDPNTDIVLWESAAILIYVVDQYDPHHRLSFGTSPNKYFVQQWLAFQISGQGPYFGQATWFARFHTEKIPSAIDRYVKEIERVIGVLDDALAREKSGWLVGGRCSIADIAFVTWAVTGEGLLQQLGRTESISGKNPSYDAWLASLKARPAVKSGLEHILEARKAHGLP